MSYLSPGASSGQGGQNSAGGANIQTELVASSQDLTAARKVSSRGVHQQRSRRRSTVGNVLHTAESIKEKQVLDIIFTMF